MEDNSSFNQFCICLDSIDNLKQFTQYIGELYREAGDTLALTNVSSDLQNRKRELQYQIENSIEMSCTNAFTSHISPIEIIQKYVQEYRDMFRSAFEVCYKAFNNSNYPEIVREFQKINMKGLVIFLMKNYLRDPIFLFYLHFL